MYVLCMFVTLRGSGVLPLLIASKHFLFKTTPLCIIFVFIKFKVINRCVIT